VTITATIALAMWAFLRDLECDGGWSMVMAASIGIGLLLKGLIAAVFPIAAVHLLVESGGKVVFVNR
jgi:4-amino-4-deoxy-L-arabinose transferase-like glycosyltransferase